MEKKKLYMIGNSHIDPVWFWNWEEGMQEVKSTFASALERMKEFEDFRFTSTSTAFFEWIEAILPDMFEEIKRRVEEGRWELTGGWFIEPDCQLPCGEALVRQGLYGQRYLKSRFGRMAQAGSNVDSFGHSPVLPQILQKSGMKEYIFMRPRLDTPVFVWESDDGSRVNAISLPAEYTTWFHDPTVKNIQTTLDRTPEYDRMVCCYGVGNHGGGPTIENIQSILRLREDESFENVELAFAHYDDFFRDITGWELPVLTGPFEKVNEGCYSIDSPFKKRSRMAQGRLLEADNLMSMAAVFGGGWMKQTENMERLWKTVLFNQFHDTMGGTAIRCARDEAMMQLGGVCAAAGEIRALAMQSMANRIDTRGEGCPLILFNPAGAEFSSLVEAELEWFCQAPLRLLSPEGEEIPYQRIHTDAKVRHTTLGGRRRFVFRAQVPSFGFAVYRVEKRKPALFYNPNMEIQNKDASVLENEYIRAEFDCRTGELTSLVEKETGYEALRDHERILVYTDERDAWGGLQGRRYEKTDQEFRLISVEKVESGPLREVIRVRKSCGETKLEQHYSLGEGERELRVDNHLTMNHTWTLLKEAYPVGECRITEAEGSYGSVRRQICGEDHAEYYMQRFVDVRDEKGAGLCVANDGKYAFNMEEGRLQITISRSAIYAQGNSPDWYNETETYRYTDQGEQDFCFLLRPHGKRLAAGQAYGLAAKCGSGCLYLADSVHPGREKTVRRSFFCVKDPGVELVLVKKCEDDDSFVARLLETEGEDRTCILKAGEGKYPFSIGRYEIKTLKIDREKNTAREVNLLEWE